jgi:cell division protein ZapA (FtsZ GTPase activity inhibitor)
MSERQKVRVTIFHHQYTLAATEQAGEVESLAEQVDDLMVKIARQAGNVDTQNVAVLTCLHLADRLRAVEREHEGLKSRVDDKSRELATMLDSALEK